ncbi:hypothetical protein ACOSZA_12360 [Mammaliicoccus sciuri]|uniref:hypothetical protein n=1 Tax=Mammaliicoccus sciuri TaxID=1296 RepID=UPI003B9E189A
MKKLLSLLVLSMFVLVILSGCGKGAEGKLVGKTFSIQVDGEIPGKYTFKDNGLLEIKDNSTNLSGSASYEFEEVDGKEYVVFWNRPDGERILGKSVALKESKDLFKDYWFYDEDSNTLKALDNSGTKFIDNHGYLKDKKYLKNLKFEDDKYHIKLIEEN